MTLGRTRVAALGWVVGVAGACAGDRPEQPPHNVRETPTPAKEVPARQEIPAAQAPAVREPAAAPPANHPTGQTEDSTSRGGPSGGTLSGAVPLPEQSPGLVSNPKRPNRQGYWATAEVVKALTGAAAAVFRELPGSAVTVNDLSLEQGGPIPHHGSHQNGRDVDVLFYLLDAQRQPRGGKGVPLDPDGKGWDFGDLVDPSDDVRVFLDVPRTWRFLQALVEDTSPARVQRIFVVEHVRAMLLEHAKRTRAPRSAIQRIEQLTCQPGSPHDDHLHIRFFCTPDDIEAGCEDSYPMYGWQRRYLRDQGTAPVIARHPRRRKKARTVSREEARKAAGPMHARVARFLDRRETWADKPHPGRPWCR